MGYIRHHAILVTSWNQKAILRAFRIADKIFDEIAPVSVLEYSALNGGYYSFAVFPDGSKEGEIESDRGDSARTRFIDWIEDQRYEDGSSSLAYVEVQYGDENRETKILRNSDKEAKKCQCI